MTYLLIHSSAVDNPLGEAVEVTVDNQRFLSYCGLIETRRVGLISGGVDKSLIDLVCRCLSIDPKYRPALVELATAVRERVRNRGPGAVARETDEAIRLLLNELLLVPLADISPSTPAPAAVNPPGSSGSRSGRRRRRDDDDDDDGDDTEGDRSAKRQRT